MTKPPKIVDADSAAHHFRRVLALADELKQKRLAIYEHHYDYMCFGSWTISAGRRRDCYEFSWDGREFFLSISHSPDISGGRPQTWTPTESHKFSSEEGRDPLDFIATFFAKKEGPNQAMEPTAPSGRGSS